MVRNADFPGETPSQTAGPYVHIGCTPNFVGIGGVFAEDLGASPFPPDAEGSPIVLVGRVFDGTGAPLRDVLVETWQADGAGRFGPGAAGYARRAADPDTGEWVLNTIKPGAVGAQAPHVSFWIVARGINIGLQTRAYFEGDDHSGDPLLTRLEHPNRARTLIAKDEGNGRFRFDIRLQGDGETVFLDF